MKQDYSNLTDEELLEKAKRMKKVPTYDAFIVGFLIGVAIWSIISKGFGLLTFLPLIYLPIAGRNKTKLMELNALLEERKLSDQEKAQ